MLAKVISVFRLHFPVYYNQNLSKVLIIVDFNSHVEDKSLEFDYDTLIKEQNLNFPNSTSYKINIKKLHFPM
jgi:hypothetical protein